MSYSIESDVYKWAYQFPLDRWWRHKHNVPFGSSQHRDVSFIDQLIEYQEDALYLMSSKKKDKYIAGSGNWLTERKPSEEEIQDMFDNIII